MKQTNEKPINEKPAESAVEMPAEIQLPRADYEALLKKLSDLEALKDRMMRSAADFENAKKRIAKEREEFSRFALENVMHDLLPVLDNFERAFSHRVDEPAQRALWSGIELVYKQLIASLRSHGLTRVDAIKKPFDPHWHEAVGQVKTDTEPEGTIAEEMLAGYSLRGKLLRPAKVKVFVCETDREKIQTNEKVDQEHGDNQ